MERETRIRKILESTFQPMFMDLANESHTHSVPKGSETHFRLILVSEKFTGQSRVNRSRMVTEALKAEFASGLHALSQRTHSPEEWSEMNESLEMTSPPCFGGSKNEK